MQFNYFHSEICFQYISHAIDRCYFYLTLKKEQFDDILMNHLPYIVAR